MGSSSSFGFILFLLIPLAVILFIVFRRKKNQITNNGPTKKKKDEVWRSIKYYLKQNNEQGKEIIDSYVAKRDNQTFEAWKKNNKDKWHKMSSKEKKQIKEEFRKHPKELYVVVFTTRDSKTGVEDKPRAIECEIVYSKTITNHSKETRNIVINGEKDYATESLWIDPLRKRDEQKLLKEEKRQEKRELKKQERAKKMMAKQKARNESK